MSYLEHTVLVFFKNLLFIWNSNLIGCYIILFANSGNPNSKTFVKWMNKNFGGWKTEKTMVHNLASYIKLNIKHKQDRNEKAKKKEGWFMMQNVETTRKQKHGVLLNWRVQKCMRWGVGTKTRRIRHKSLKETDTRPFKCCPDRWLPC